MGPHVDIVTENVLTYIAGYLAYRARKMQACPACMSVLTKDTAFVTCDREALIGLKNFTGESDVEVGSLQVPSSALYETTKMMFEITETQEASALCGHGVLSSLRACVEATQPYQDLVSNVCCQKAVDGAVAVFLRMQLHGICARMTNVKTGENSKSRKHVVVSSRV